MGNRLNEDRVLENAICLSADIFHKLHDIKGDNYSEVVSIIAFEARELEKKLAPLAPDTFDYYEELEKHEQEVLEYYTLLWKEV